MAIDTNIYRNNFRKKHFNENYYRVVRGDFAAAKTYLDCQTNFR
jgi:hypothetical protein